MTRRSNRGRDRWHDGREDADPREDAPAPEIPDVGGHDHPADGTPWRPNPLERDLMEDAE